MTDSGSLETPQDSEGQDDLTILVALVRTPKQIEILQMKPASSEWVSAVMVNQGPNAGKTHRLIDFFREARKR
jgi:hypothetical protein